MISDPALPSDLAGLPDSIEWGHVDGLEFETDTGSGWWVRLSGWADRVGDLWLARWMELRIVGDEGSCSFMGRVELRDGAPHVAELRFFSEPGQGEVKQADLRHVQASAIVAAHAVFAVRPSIDVDGRYRFDMAPISLDPDGFWDETQLAMNKARAGKTSRSLTPEFLREVAAIYRNNIDHAPISKVMDTYKVPQRTAGYWIQRCRKFGLLPPTTAGKKKA